LAPVDRLCFVCLGNIVRSPLAEKLFIHLANQAGAGHKYQVDSAGTSSWHIGEAPDSRMRRVAARHGVAYNGRARQFQLRDFDRFDLILAMDQHNYAELVRMTGSEEQRNKIHLLREFDPEAGPGAVVPDPYYGGIDGFENTYQVIERSCQGLLQVLEAGEL
jgi:protein-tyrosine phosphatase